MCYYRTICGFCTYFFFFFFTPLFQHCGIQKEKKKVVTKKKYIYNIPAVTDVCFCFKKKNYYSNFFGLRLKVNIITRYYYNILLVS